MQHQIRPSATNAQSIACPADQSSPHAKVGTISEQDIRRAARLEQRPQIVRTALASRDHVAGGCFNGSVMTAAVLAAASTSTDGPPLRQSVNKSHCQDLVVQISLVPFKQTVQAKKPNYRERVRGNNTRLEENLMCGRESRQSCPTRCRHTITHN